MPILRLWFNVEAEPRQDFRLSRRAINGLQRLLKREQDHGWGSELEILIYVYWLAHGLSYRVVSSVFGVPKATTLRGPTTGSGTDEGEETAATWRYFEEMHAALGGKPAINSPVLVYPKKDPVPMLMAMVEPQFTSGNKDAGGAAAASSSSTSSTSAAASSSSSTTPAAAPPCKRARSNADMMLEFLKAEAAKEQRRHEQNEAKTNRFL
ncbi:hypothetical protein ACEWY4_003482 [Coilia grayii]|uniref:Uncharacterized protein n=1 Tax=Coilia grayii TaxID=363190 RepID=A0ABD1KRT0_9TELE